jgi:protein-tyrosine-phosphatase
MKPEGAQALAEIGVAVQPHLSRRLTVELTQQADAIYCMTEDAGSRRRSCRVARAGCPSRVR